MEFANTKFDKKDISKHDDNSANRYLLENNVKQAADIYGFFCNNDKLLHISGFKGTGKNFLCSHVCKFLNADVLRLNYKCFETTILDDILLEFFKQFKIYSQNNFIKIPNIKYENFTQRINAYFETVKTPILIVVSSFEEILKGNRAEIINFLNQICKYENVKIIVISKKSELSDFEIPHNKVTLLGLEKSIFEKYLKTENFKQIGPLSDELYKHTKGYFFNVTLSIKLMQYHETGLLEFISGFTKSLLTFNDYILREALALVDPVSGHLFRFLATIRHPVSIVLLKKLHLIDEEKIKFFVDYMLLSQITDCVYLRSDYKGIAENSIPENVSVKLHQGCADLYRMQLPLKPFERDIMVSRQTMRNEIDYHTMFIPQKPIVIEEKSVENFHGEKTEISEPVQIIESQSETKEEKFQKMSFIFEDDSDVIDTIANSIETYISYKDEKTKQDNLEKTFNLEKLISTAISEEKIYNYKHACSLYMKALARKNEADYQFYLPKIYEGLARNNQKISNWFEAENYYKIAREKYFEQSNVSKANEMLYNTANIYYNTFKRSAAAELLKQLETAEMNNEIKIKVFNLFALTDVVNAEEYYKKALLVDSQNISTEVLSELYYKYANICDEKEDINSAVKYYKKCVDLGRQNNPYLADSYSGIAQLFDEIGQVENAIKYYFESYHTDEISKDINGLYVTSMRLAEIFSINDYDNAELYYKKALKYANELEENFYIMTCAADLGDFYFNRKNYKNAVKFLNLAYDTAVKNNYQENVNKIKLRLEDIKHFLGEERFSEIEGQKIL